MPMGPTIPLLPYGPKGEGWVFQLTGYHYHNMDDPENHTEGAQYVMETLIKNLKTKTITLPATGEGPQAMPEEIVSVKELGISSPMIIKPGRILEEIVLNEEEYEAAVARAQELGIGGRTPGLAGGQIGNIAPSQFMNKKLRRFDFVVQFCWKETTASERKKKREEEAKQAQATAAAAQPAEGAN